MKCGKVNLFFIGGVCVYGNRGYYSA